LAILFGHVAARAQAASARDDNGSDGVGHLTLRAIPGMALAHVPQMCEPGSTMESGWSRPAKIVVPRQICTGYGIIPLTHVKRRGRDRCLAGFGFGVRIGSKCFGWVRPCAPALQRGFRYHFGVGGARSGFL